MRCVAYLAACLAAFGQSVDPAAEAYDSLKARDYDRAIAAFERAIEAAPGRSSLRKDLAYTLLKIGESERARDQFHTAMQLEPTDAHVAREYAFLCNETKQVAQARRVFDRLRQTGDTVSEQAFQNIDRPLAAGIDRWRRAIALGADNFSAHFELATLAEQRDELELAAEHFERAWRLLPERRSVLVDLGRVWKNLNRLDEAYAALLAASHGGDARAAESAREFLPARHAFVAEFRRALELDTSNAALRRELAYLLLRMDRQSDAEQEFRVLTETVPGDLLSATQLGFLLYARGEHAAAKPLFERVLAGNDEDLANRVRAVMRIPQVLRPRPETPPAAVDAKLMAERSLKAGYMKDALTYLQVAHEADPVDFGVMLRMAWTYNILHQDKLAIRWFDLARKSPDPLVASEASQAFGNLRPGLARFRTTAWAFPLFSTRWHDLFSYGQVKTEINLGLPFRPYASVRFIGDTRVTLGPGSPEYLSESSFIVGLGLASRPWHGITAWGEAGQAISYVKHHMLPDYRGGVSYSRGYGHSLAGERSGWFAQTSADGIFVSRFGNDFLLYAQNRAGMTMVSGTTRLQLYWNGNATLDALGQSWARFLETGPGLRLRLPLMPRSAYFTVDLLRGAYLINDGSRPAKFNDLRAGIWYAFTY